MNSRKLFLVWLWVMVILSVISYVRFVELYPLITANLPTIITGWNITRYVLKEMEKVNDIL